jgi:hypothetical protein
MFERDDMVSREDLYRCAKAMGGWSQQDGKFSEALIRFSIFSRAPNVGTGSEPRRGRQRRRILVDPQIHLAARQTECFAAPAALSSVA